MKSYIHVYTGNGKGKTTAAFGLALRAAGAGKKVFIAQFVKGKTYSEIEAVQKYLPSIQVEQYGLGCFIVNEPTEDDVRAARNGLEKVRGLITAGVHDLLVLDEVFIALYYKLFDAGELIDVLKSAKNGMELVLTGRYAPEEIIELADLVTEMKEIKHYYTSGLQARKGIEY
ncbi:MAG: cob(I)yrinic acid a,c-diamide adenosyltransferase [Bacteroidales bacterium]